MEHTAFVRVKRMNQFTVQNGRFAFRIQLANGTSADGWMPVQELGEVITLMLRAASAAPCDRPVAQVGKSKVSTVFPVLARSLGTGQAQDGTTIYSVDLGVVELAFAIRQEPATAKH